VQQLKAKMKIILSILVSIWVNQIIGQDNMNIIAKERINEYINELNEVRKNPALLSNYEFENRHSNHYNRLKLNIAMFNDFRYSDYLIAKFLFEQESNWRKSDDYYETGYFDNLYFSAFLVSKYKQPEIIVNFWNTKMIDMDTGTGFDGEFLVSIGISETYKYLRNSERPNKDDILAYIGISENECQYTETRLNQWRDFKIEYFKDYILPIEDPLWLLYSVRENEILKDIFEDWINSTEEWDDSRRIKYWTISNHLQDIENEIKSIRKILEHNNETEGGISLFVICHEQTKNGNP